MSDLDSVRAHGERLRAARDAADTVRAELREVVRREHRNGASPDVLAQAAGVSRRTIFYWIGETN